jgi:hypothetical protein
MNDLVDELRVVSLCDGRISCGAEVFGAYASAFSSCAS